MQAHRSLIGKETGKIIALGTREMAYHTCDAAAKKGDGKVKDHDCRVNWGGSSKGMESSVAAEMLNNIKDNSFQISTLIGDDDSTTMAMVR